MSSPDLEKSDSHNVVAVGEVDGGLTIVVAFFTLPSRSPGTNNSWQAWLHLDWVGSILNLATVLMLLLPLQMGGNEWRWNSPVVIALFCLVCFAVHEYSGGAHRLHQKVWHSSGSVLVLGIQTRGQCHCSH